MKPDGADDRLLPAASGLSGRCFALAKQRFFCIRSPCLDESKNGHCSSGLPPMFPPELPAGMPSDLYANFTKGRHEFDDGLLIFS